MEAEEALKVCMYHCLFGIHYFFFHFSLRQCICVERYICSVAALSAQAPICAEPTLFITIISKRKQKSELRGSAIISAPSYSVLIGMWPAWQ